MTGNEQLIQHLYERFNARDVDGVLANLAENVAWANGMEGTHVHGLDAVRDYWTYQWTVIDPHVEPTNIRKTEDGSNVVTVHQVVRDLEGKVLLDETIEHVFRIENSRVVRFDIQGNSQLSAIPHQGSHIMRVPLGTVSHFSIGVEDPVASAAWWLSNFDLDEWSRSGKGILLGNDAIMLGLFKGSRTSGVLGHLGFRTSDIDALKTARDVLRANGVDLEDPGDEIGPVGPGSASVGLWFHDPDGYRWELYVEAPDV